MRVYQNLGTGNETDLPRETVSFPFKITRAKIIKPAYDSEPSLVLRLRGEAGCAFPYHIIGQDLIEQFEHDAKASQVRGLIGKKVSGFITPGRTGLQGITLEKLTKINQ